MWYGLLGLVENKNNDLQLVKRAIGGSQSAWLMRARRYEERLYKPCFADGWEVASQFYPHRRVVSMLHCLRKFDLP